MHAQTCLRRCTRTFLAAFIGLLGQLGAAEAEERSPEAPYFVGLAEVDVTPDYPVRLHGFGGRRTESEGVLQRIWAKALAIRDGQRSPVVLVTLDNLGIPLTMVDEVARRLQEKAQLPREHLIVTFTHTHSAPKVTGSADTVFGQAIPADHQAHIDQYTRQLTDALEQVSLEAIANCQQPARLSWGVGKVTFARNRRTAGGPVDHDLPVLAVVSPEGEMLAVYASYACHNVTLSHNKISGDWAGYAQELIERKYPGCVAMISIGTGSDSDPDSGVTGDRADIATAQGAQIADEVSRLVAGDLRPLHGKLQSVQSRIALPLNPPPTREQLKALAAQGGSAGFNAETQLARLDRGEALQTHIDYAVQSLMFGDELAMVFLAGEVCVDYGLRLKTELNRDRLWVHGYSNDFCAYIPSERLLQEGGYGGGAEVIYFALPNTFQPGLEQKIIDEVKRQVPQSFHVRPGTQGVPPKSPEESLQCMRTHADLRIELVAAEPLINDPVAIEFGPDGRLWVTEMLDYAREVDERFDPTGQIKVLSDRDADGRYDHAAVFADGLRFPTGLAVWRRGILVCDAPDILYFEDTDGDGKAEMRRTLYSGFATHNPHGRVNSLRLGLDNWLYGSGGIFGGRIRSFAGAEVDATNRDFRLRPDTGEIEAVSGSSGQSRVRDDWANWFGCDSGTLIRHYPLEERYLRRNPLLAPPASATYVPTYANSQQLYPVGELVTFKLSGPAGRPTSACGLEIYRDDLLGEDYAANSFTCEPVNQLIHRLVLTRSGTTFQGRRAETERDREFLVSTDRWFRPVQVRTGPDGALWIVDMYRYVIEHPRWIPPETVETLDTMAGTGRGRIYRVVPNDHELRAVPRFDTMTVEQLARSLDTPNGTQRDIAHLQLLWRNDTSAQGPLTEVALHGRTAAARVQALCVLEGLGLSSAAVLAQALSDSHSEVRRHAIRLCEPLAAAGDQAALQCLLQPARPWEQESEAAVLLQLASTLGQLPDKRAGTLLGRLMLRSVNDEYLRAAQLSSIRVTNVSEVVDVVLNGDSTESQAIAAALVSMAAQLENARAVSVYLSSLKRQCARGAPLTAEQWRTMASVIEAMNVHEGLRAAMSASGDDLAQLRIQAEQLVQEAELAEPIRIAAIQMLAQLAVRDPGQLGLLAERIGPREPLAVQQAAIEGLVTAGHDQVPSMLLAAWTSSTPTVRGYIADGLMSRTSWQTQLLDALENAIIRPTELDLTLRGRLLLLADKAQAERAAALLQVADNQDRRAVVERYLPAAGMSGTAERGRPLFAKTCANCHRLEEAGQAIGPDLAALTSKSAEYLLTAILDPSREVDARYLTYSAVLHDGRLLSGMLVDETSTSVTLVEQADKRHVVLRRDLEHLQTTGKSLMPDGLENDLSPQDMADLLAYLLASRPQMKIVAGNKPQSVGIDDQGQYVLLASAARIFGSDITYEAALANIGMWHGHEDHVRWELEVDRSGEFDVWLEWACADDSAGNTLRLEGSPESLRWKVMGTGSWQQYQKVRIGSISLPAGRHMVTIRPDGPLQRALLDLKTVYLIPRNIP